MHRPLPQCLELVVVFSPVKLERVNASRTFGAIKPASGDDGSNGIDTIFHPVTDGNGDVAQPKTFQHFQAAFARSQFPSLRVVRHDMASIDMVSFDHFAHVMSKIDAG